MSQKKYHSNGNLNINVVHKNHLLTSISVMQGLIPLFKTTFWSLHYDQYSFVIVKPADTHAYIRSL